MKFKDIKFSKDLRMTIGLVEETNKYFLSFPVTNGAFDYEEYYEISEEEYNSFLVHLSNAADLLKRCREQEVDGTSFYLLNNILGKYSL